MSDRPDVSVVMSVYNGAEHLRETLDSIMAQEGVSFELVVVDDGSTDQSGEILKEYASLDRRVRVIHQENQGLTRALIRGCLEAKGKYLARHDVGDLSLPGRLVKQLACIAENTDAAFVSCGTRFIGPGKELLYDVKQDPAESTRRLKTLELDEIRGPSIHGCTLFPRTLYDRVGGYRPDFYFAQDLDLWIRLAEHGRHIVLPEILYQASIRLGSISGLYRNKQIKTARMILECARLRREGKSEEPALRKARSIRPQAERHRDRLVRARALYFIGMCLKKRKDPQAQKYFKQALHAFPLHLKSAARLLMD